MRKFLVAALTLIVAAISMPGTFATSAQAQTGDAAAAGVEAAIQALSATPTGLPTSDAGTHTQTALGKLLDALISTALAMLKKRIIDTMTDEIITWINGGGSPKFITNFGQEVFQPALNQAIGDTIQQSQLAGLCSPYSFKVNLELTAPQFQQQPVTCTLNSIVSNFNDFYNNFSAGGIIGYYDLLQPQNNQYGVDILTKSNLESNAQKITAQNILQTQVNVGFKANQCGGWQLINKNTRQIINPQVNIDPNLSANIPLFGPYADPNNPPPLDYDHIYAGTGNDSVLTAAIINNNTGGWQCSKLEVATPGTALAEGLNKSLYANLDLTINDQDITNAIAMIADAAFNRLIKAGVSGLQGIIKSATSGGGSAGGETGTGTNGFDENGNGIGGGSGIPTSTLQAVDTYTNAQNAVIQSQYLVELNQASSSLADASTTLATASSTNQTLIGTLNSLKSCVNSSNPDYGWAQGNLTIAVSSTPAAIQQVADQVSASTTVIAALISTVQTATAATFGQINPGDITNAATNANNIDGSAQAILTGVNTTLGQAQTKLTQCQASK